METLQNLIFGNFGVIFAVTAVWTIGVFAWMSWRRNKRNLFAEEANNVLFEERTASGRSHKNWYTKLGGASHCLRLVITHDELWITTLFPFSALAGIFDMDHRISIDRISHIESNKGMFNKSFIINYTGTNNASHVVEVTPRNFEKFELLLKQYNK